MITGGDPETRPPGDLVFEDLDADLATALSSASVADSLDEAGFRNQVMDAVLNPLAPGMRFAGRAATVQFAPTAADSEKPYRDISDFVDSLAPGSVPVIATSGDTRTAYWGELFSCAALGRGSVGCVCDGPIRDSAKIRELGYPVVAPGRRPIDFRARMRVIDHRVTIHCGGVIVAPGDLVVADDDGVVVVPQRVEGTVLSKAVNRIQTESDVRAQLLAGARLEEVWDRWGVL